MKKRKQTRKMKKAVMSSAAAVTVAISSVGIPVLSSAPLIPMRTLTAFADEQAAETYSVAVTGGKMSTGKTSGTVKVSKLVTVKANTAPTGKKFSHWERNGVKVSTNSTYSFYMPSCDISLEAVFAAATSTAASEGTAVIESITPNASTGKISFTAALNVPKNCTYVKGGIVATSDSSIGSNVDDSNATYVKLSTKGTARTKNLKYTWTKGGMTKDTICYVKGYLVYKDSAGVEHTVYSDCVAANINGIAEESGAFFDEETGVLTLKGHVTSDEIYEKRYNANLKEIYAAPGTVLPADCENLFSGTKATKIDLSNANTSNVTNMTHMFAWNNGLKELDLSGFNTKKVTNMYGMFVSCYNLLSLDLSSFDTSGVTSMKEMFYGCSNMETLNTTGWDTSKVTDMQYMFYYDRKLKDWDISNWDLSSVKTLYYAFYSCEGMTSIDLSKTNLSNLEDASYAFYDCTGLKDVKFGNSTTSNLKTVYCLFNYCTALETVDVSTLNTSSLTDMGYMFDFCRSLKTIDVSNFDTSNVTNMSGVFYCCYSLESVDVSGFDTSNATSMSLMFCSCSKLSSIDVSKFDTSKVQYFDSMFSGCSGLTEIDVSHFNTGSALGLSSMFSGCTNLAAVDVSGFDTSNVVYMNYVFSGCSSLTSIDLSGFDTSNTTGMRGMFSGCSGLTLLDVSDFDTSKVTVMESMFKKCSALTSLDVSGFDTANVTDMSGMFQNCSALTSLDVSGFNTAKVTAVYNMFMGCTVLPYVDLSSFDLTKVTKTANYADMFTDSPLLTANLNKFDWFSRLSTAYMSKIRMYFYPSDNAVKAVVKAGDNVTEYSRDDWTLYSGTEYYITHEFVSRSTQSTDNLELSFFDAEDRQLPVISNSSRPYNNAKAIRALDDLNRDYMRIYVKVGDHTTYTEYKTGSKCVYMNRALLSGLQVPEGYKLYGWKVEDSRYGVNDRVYTLTENEYWWAYNDVTFTAVLVEKPVRETIALSLDTPVTAHYEDGDSDTLSFKAKTEGTYVFTSDGAHRMEGCLYSDAEMKTLIASDEYSIDDSDFRIIVELAENQTVYMKNFSYDSYNPIYDYTVKVRKQREYPVRFESLVLDTTANGKYVDIDEYDVFAFTPSEDGVYLFKAENTKAGITGALYDDEMLNNCIAGKDENSETVTVRAVLTAGQTVYFKPARDNIHYSCDYTVSVTKKEVTVSEPVEITLGTAEEGSYTDPDEFDRFVFTAPEDGTYKFTVENDDDTDMYTVWYEDSALSNVIRSKDSIYSSNGQKCTFSFNMTEGQTVYLAAKAYNEDNNFNYSVIVEQTSPTTLTLGQYTAGHFADSDDYDYFSFTAAEDGYYSFSGNSDYDITPWLYRNNDLTGFIKSGSYSWGDNGAQFYVGISLSAGQTVYLKPVAEYSDNSDFNFAVTVLKRADMGLKSLALKTPTAGHFESSDEYDFFSFKAEEAGTYYFASDCDTDTQGYLYSDAELTDQIAYDDDSNGNYQFKIEYTLEAGQTVYLKPVEYGEDESCDYTVTVTNYDPSGSSER